MLYGRFSDSSPQHSRENAVIRGPRMIRDETGEVWTVVERKADAIVGARRPACLIFHTDRGFTRLWIYPEKWDELSDRELLALCEDCRPNSQQSA